MSKNKSLTVRAEVLPMKKPATPTEAAEAMIKKIVQSKVAEMMATDSSILQPFLQTRRVMAELRKNQNVIETRKFSFYIEDWGCIICSRKDAGHAGLAMCPECHGRVVSRMTSTIRRATANRPADDGEAQDLEEMAQAALARSLKKLVPGGDK
jgi:hypothetical protein